MLLPFLWALLPVQVPQLPSLQRLLPLGSLSLSTYFNSFRLNALPNPWLSWQLPWAEPLPTLPLCPMLVSNGPPPGQVVSCPAPQRGWASVSPHTYDFLRIKAQSLQVAPQTKGAPRGSLPAACSIRTPSSALSHPELPFHQPEDPLSTLTFVSIETSSF